MGSIYFGYNFVSFNACGDVIAYKNKWNVKEDKSFYIGTLTSGIILGSILGCFLTDKIVKLFNGYRKAIIFCDIFAILVLISLISSTNYLNLLICRVLTGLLAGLNLAIIPIYNREFTPTEISGMVGSFH